MLAGAAACASKASKAFAQRALQKEVGHADATKSAPQSTHTRYVSVCISRPVRGSMQPQVLGVEASGRGRGEAVCLALVAWRDGGAAVAAVAC